VVHPDLNPEKSISERKIIMIPAYDSPKIRAVIVDDDQNSRDIIRNYIDEYCPNIEILRQCDSVKSAYVDISRLNPDLVFLDIQMPGGTGFDLLRMFNPVTFKVIFVTAYSEYAFDAFRYSAVDFILKPCNVEELMKAIKKVEIEIKHDRYSDLSGLLELMPHENKPQSKLVISSARGFTVVSPEEIIMCRAEGYCTMIYLTGKIVISSSRNLKYYESLLPSEKFMRVHNSYLINLNHVKEYSNQEVIMLSESRSSPLSNVHKQEFLKIFKSRNGRKKA
jgi:two-component system, LytTR family, response regulator